MRLITWNCKGGFARKHEAIAGLHPDVLIVPEAERLTEIANVLGSDPVNSVQWVGENPRKGLGVLSYGKYRLAIHPDYEPRLRWILPLEVTGPTPFTLLAVWTVPDVETRYYVTCLFEAVRVYSSLLEASRVIVAGDFNNNVRFNPNHPLNFAVLLAQFEQHGLKSLYHQQTGHAHGAEAESTFFLHHKAEKGHHIDFVFAKPELYRNGFSFPVEEHAKWSKASDHMPLICTFGTDCE